MFFLFFGFIIHLFFTHLLCLLFLLFIICKSFFLSIKKIVSSLFDNESNSLMNLIIRGQLGAIVPFLVNSMCCQYINFNCKFIEIVFLILNCPPPFIKILITSLANSSQKNVQIKQFPNPSDKQKNFNFFNSEVGWYLCTH